MSVTVIKNKSLAASRNRFAFYPPVSSGLIALHLPGGATLTEQGIYARRNYAPGEDALYTVSGTPAYADDHIGLASTSRLTMTGETEPASATLMWVGSVQETDFSSTSRRPHLMGWGGDGTGLSLHASGATQYQLGCMIGGSYTYMTRSVSSIATDHLMCATVKSGVGLTLQNLTGETMVSTANTGARGTGTGAASYHLGGVFGGTLTNVGAHKTIMAAAWNRALSEAEIEAMAAWFRSAQTDLSGSTPAW